jgi:hypothetical protein
MEDGSSSNSFAGSAHSTDTTDLALSYPTLSVDDSIASLVLVAHNTMRPAPPSRTPSEAASCLEDSAYDLVSNPDLSESGILSDDDARTESLASFDGNTPDDMSVINSADESDEEDALNTPLESVMLGNMHTQRSAVSSNEPIVDVTPTIGESGYTSRTVHAQSSFSYLDFYINDAEPNGPKDIRLIHTIQSVEEANCNPELTVYNSQHVGVEMHMAVSKTSPKPRSSLRVLVLSYYTHVNGDIAEHIKAALQTALPEDATENQPALVMHHCSSGDFGPNGREIILRLDRHNPTLVSIRGGKVYSGKESFPQWDLAIFLHTSLANIPAYEIPRVENTFEKARLAMRSCSTPSMDLSMHHPLYRAVPHLYTCDRKSLHLRVSTQEKKDGRVLPIELLPVDLDKFLAIDPRTLGRHLACITERDLANDRSSQKRKRSFINYAYAAAKPHVNTVIHEVYVTAKKCINLVITRAQAHRHRFEGLQWIDIMLGLLVALTAVLFCTQIPSYLSGAQTFVETCIPPAPPAQATIQQVNNWADIIAQKISAYSEKSAAEHEDKWVDIVAPKMLEDSPVSSMAINSPSTASPVPQTKENKTKRMQEMSATEVQKSPMGRSTQDEKIKNEMEKLAEVQKEYTVDLVGGHTLVLTPPTHLAGRIKKLDVSIVRNGRKLEALTKPLINGGAWAIDVRKDQAQGEATLVVRGHYQIPRVGKTRFTYDFPVDFGNIDTKTSFEAVRDMVTQEFVLIQNNAMELSTRMTTSLQQYMSDLQQHTSAIQKHAMKRVDDTRKALINLSSRDMSITEWKTKRQQLRQLKKTKRAFRKQGKDIVAQVKATLRAAQDMALQQYDESINAIRSLSRWQRETAWPVRAADWKPNTVLKRGWGNAQGLLRKLQGGPKTIDAPAQCGRPKCKTFCSRRKVTHQHRNCDF